MPNKNSYLKRIFIDVAGLLIVILSLLIGWLPGPGGIPLFLAGLALLASNHKWARKWLHHLKKHSNNLADLIFRDHTYIKLAYDLIAISLIILVIILFGTVTHSLLKGALLWLGFLSAAVLLFNRRRGQRLNKFFRRSINS